MRVKIVADQMGVFALAAAGYDPQALVKFWDRFAETKGKTGNLFSDFFGMTSPESKRLREMIRNLGVLPAACVETRKAVTTDEFQTWKSAVANYVGLGRKEDLHGVISKLSLEPALRGDVSHLRFSPDGKYILAQDDSGINVLTREPFAPVFRIEAPGATHAQFTPDSSSILFYNSSLRVQKWDINEQRVTAAYDMVIHKHCMQTELSPEGKLLACISSDSDFQIFDVATNNQVFEKKRFFQPSRYSIFIKQLELILNADDSSDEPINWVNMGFSPDGRYFVIGSREMNSMSNTNETLLAIDTQTMTQIQFKGPVKKLIAGGFTFTGRDKLIALNREDLNKSAIVSFPSGDIQEQFQLPNGKLSATNQSDFLFIRPAGQYKVGVMRVADKAMIMGGKTSALDAYDKIFVAERKDGELALYSPDKNSTLATVKLPKNALARTRGLAVSTDFKWLAVSERARGAIWDLSTGQMLFNVRGFRGGYFSDDGFFYGDFPKFEETERSIAKIDLSKHKDMQTTAVSDKRSRQYGPFLLVIREEKENTPNSFYVMDFRDTKTQELIWSKPFPKESPRYSVSSRDATIAMFWSTNTEAAKAEIKKDPKLAQQLSSAKEKDGNYFLQIYDAKSGKLLGQLIVETGKGSFRIEEVFAIQDHVVVSDSENRVLLYSLATGKQEGKVFGGYATANQASGLLCVENERGQLTVYDLATREKRDQFTFSSPISAMRFSTDGKKLFVLATNQVAYVLDISKLSH